MNEIINNAVEDVIRTYKPECTKEDRLRAKIACLEYFVSSIKKDKDTYLNARKEAIKILKQTSKFHEDGKIIIIRGEVIEEL